MRCQFPNKCCIGITHPGKKQQHVVQTVRINKVELIHKAKLLPPQNHTGVQLADQDIFRDVLRVQCKCLSMLNITVSGIDGFMRGCPTSGTKSIHASLLSRLQTRQPFKRPVMFVRIIIPSLPHKKYQLLSRSAVTLQLKFQFQIMKQAKSQLHQRDAGPLRSRS